MTVLLSVSLVVCIGLCFYFGVSWMLQLRRVSSAEASAEQYRRTGLKQESAFEAESEKLHQQIARLAKWTGVADADDKARELIETAQETLTQAETDSRILLSSAEQQFAELVDEAQTEASELRREGREKARQLTERADAALASASDRAGKMIEEANRKADEIAGKAMDAVRNAEFYERTARAMKNTIDGLGDEYLMPIANLLDGLAEEYSYKQAGQELKYARRFTRELIRAGKASRCEYVDNWRREGAERFVLDAFNGNVDSILSRVKHDNAGTLRQEIKDAFSTVNFGGKAFRDAQITEEYLEARCEELRWGAIAQELKVQEREEQRRIREQIREEEKARREYEREIRQAAKEEDILRKAMAKAEAKIAAATEGQRAQYESQLAELNLRLKEAEDRNQRAVSMAQQTRRGHVYVISNVGSFGDDVYKIGLTRRLEPFDRVKELGDSSVPFNFDVHAMILSEDAPALENRLHKHFVMQQVNKANHRKEFFRASLAAIRQELDELGIETKWTMAAEAKEYRETLAIERAIDSDLSAQDAWKNRQLTLDPVDIAEFVASSGG